MTARPPSMEMPDADISSQAIKRRMPPEIKQKLAKVARLAVLRIANLILLFLPVIFTEWNCMSSHFVSLPRPFPSLIF